MDEDFVRSEFKPPGRRIWNVSPSVDAPAALLVFLDAELYLERVSAAEVVRGLEAQGRIPPVVSVFVSNNGPAAASDRVVIIGLSLSGLAAAHAALTTGRFRAAVCQSPSFWLNRERLASSLPNAGTRAAAFWIGVGDLETESGVSHPPSGLLQETSQRDSCGRGVEALRAAGYAVSRRVFHGGHDPACWRDDLTLALSWATSA